MLHSSSWLLDTRESGRFRHLKIDVSKLRASADLAADEQI